MKTTQLSLKQCNLLVGKNGSGKTSLLEAVFLLSRGKSFRHHEPKRYISHHAPSCTVWAMSEQGSLALQKRLDDKATTTVLKINDVTATAQSQLSFILPTLLIDPGSMDILEEGSGQRRQLLDWLAFHVKPEFYSEWLAYQRLLKQRNAILKNSNIDLFYAQIQAWDGQLAHHADAIHSSRQQVFVVWQDFFSQMLTRLLPHFAEQIQLSYQVGYDDKVGLCTILQERLTSDIELGYTRVGAHRADVQVLFKNKNEYGDKLKEQAVNVLSRGEKKLLITALRLSQLQTVIAYNHDIHPVILIDDIDAELDDHAIDILLDTVLPLPCQLIISSLNHHTDVRIRHKMATLSILKSYQMFHVEQGEVSEISSLIDE